MKALVYKGPWDIQLEERTLRIPEANEVTVAVIATGICGSDIHGFTGHTGRRQPNQVMGHETVGRIATIGSAVAGMKFGELVSINPVISCGECPACLMNDEELCVELRVIGVAPEIDAAFAEFVVVPSRNIIRLDQMMVTNHGALIEPLSVGFHAARRGSIQPTDSVLILGGGPIGQAAALACRRFGCDNVIVSEVVESRRKLLNSLGFVAVPPADVSSAISAMPTKRINKVIDAVGNEETISSALALSARGSTIVLLGMAAPDLKIRAYDLSVAERTIVGTFCYSRADFEATAKWVAENPEVVAKLIDTVESSDRAPEMFTKLAKREIDVSKVLISFGNV
jgi:2-desacetyl-2-hydroxyethyl bacteriochlorophyllide A dehydrogenase